MASERSVGELLDELFGFESVAKRQTALEQHDRGELVRRARSRELLGVLRGVEASEHAACESAVRAVDGYVRRVEGAALARARKRAGIVGPITSALTVVRISRASAMPTFSSMPVTASTISSIGSSMPTDTISRTSARISS